MQSRTQWTLHSPGAGDVPSAPAVGQTLSSVPSPREGGASFTEGLSAL